MKNSEVNISKEKAIELFNDASDEGKAILTNLIGKEGLTPNIMERVRTVDDAYAVLKLRQLTWNELSSVIEPYRTRLPSYYDLLVVTIALNEGWEPNIRKRDTGWVPVFNYKNHSDIDGPKFEFVDSEQLYTFYNGGQISYKTKELSDYAGKQFSSLFKGI